MTGDSGARYLGGIKALPVRLMMLTSYSRYLLRPRRYPLFTLSRSKGGLLSSIRTAKDLHLLKLVKSDGGYRYSLAVPRWPSKPYDRMAGLGGLNINAAGTEYKQQVDHAILAISRRCAYRCRHCYERPRIASEEAVSLDVWKRAVRDLEAMGTSIIVFSGGEPMLRFPDLLELVRSGDKSLSEFHVHTSGHGVTEDRARALKAAGLEAAAVGLDDADPGRHDALRGYPGAFREAVSALRDFRRAGIFTSINLCLTKDLVRSGDLPALLELAKDLGVGAVRFLEPVPVGGYQGERMAGLFSDEDRAATTDFFIRVNTSRRYASYPFVSYEAFFEAPERLGCMMGGHSHFGIDSLGNVVPCVFLPVSFGTIVSEDLPRIFHRMRAAIPRPCRQGCSAALLAESIQDRANRGDPLPVPFSALRSEWQRLYPAVPSTLDRAADS
jgi:MoaA/NifB/PqqE/SkfB family radical SAM enzyme